MTKKNRPISETEVKDYPTMIFPEDLNSQDKMFGGMLVATMDKLAGTLLFRHAEGQSFGTVYIDGISFLVPVYRGDLLLLDAAINRVWNTSCEIGIRAKVQRKRTGKIHHLSSTYFTFVAVEELAETDPESGHQKIVAAPIKYGATPRTKEQKRRWQEAEERTQERLKKKG